MAIHRVTYIGEKAIPIERGKNDPHRFILKPGVQDIDSMKFKFHQEQLSALLNSGELVMDEISNKQILERRDAVKAKAKELAEIVAARKKADKVYQEEIAKLEERRRQAIAPNKPEK